MIDLLAAREEVLGAEIEKLRLKVNVQEKVLAQLVDAVENTAPFAFCGLALMQAIRKAKKVLRGEEI